MNGLLSNLLSEEQKELMRSLVKMPLNKYQKRALKAEIAVRDKPGVRYLVPEKNK